MQLSCKQISCDCELNQTYLVHSCFFNNSKTVQGSGHFCAALRAHTKGRRKGGERVRTEPRGNHVGPQVKSRGPPGEITWAPRGNHMGPPWKSRGPPGAITWDTVEITWAPKGNHVGPHGQSRGCNFLPPLSRGLIHISPLEGLARPQDTSRTFSSSPSP